MTNVIDSGCDGCIVSDVPGFLGAENLGSTGQLDRVRTSWQTCFVCFVYWYQAMLLFIFYCESIEKNDLSNWNNSQ